MFRIFRGCFVLLFFVLGVSGQKPCDGVIGQQFRPDPVDCRVYHLCGKGKDWTIQCPPSRVWNQKLGTCIAIGSSNDTCTQSVKALPPLKPKPPSITPNLKSPSAWQYSPFGESTWRPNCPTGSKQRFAHPTKCAQYYDCGADPREDWWGKHLRECPYPTVFDEITGNCGYYTEVKCGKRQLPLDPCDYLGHICRTSHCTPCFIKFASCAGLRNGINVWRGREKTPFFVVCKDQRVVFHGKCVPSEPGKRQVFDQQYNTCVRPKHMEQGRVPTLHFGGREVIHSVPTSAPGPQLNPNPGPHRLKPFGHSDIPAGMQFGAPAPPQNMSTGPVTIITTALPVQHQQPRMSQAPPQNVVMQQQQSQTMIQGNNGPQNYGPNQNNAPQNYQQNQGNQYQQQQQQQQQQQPFGNQQFQNNNQAPPPNMAQAQNYQSVPSINNQQPSNNWQPNPIKHPQPFTNWPGSYNRHVQGGFSGTGAEAAWMQYNAGKSNKNVNSQTINIQQQSERTIKIPDNAQGMISHKSQQHTSVMIPSGQQQQNPTKSPVSQQQQTQYQNNGMQQSQKQQANFNQNSNNQQYVNQQQNYAPQQQQPGNQKQHSQRQQPQAIQSQQQQPGFQQQHQQVTTKQTQNKQNTYQAQQPQQFQQKQRQATQQQSQYNKIQISGQKANPVVNTGSQVRREFIGNGVKRERIPSGNIRQNYIGTKGNNFHNQQTMKTVSPVNPRLHPPNTNSFSYQNVQPKNVQQQRFTQQPQTSQSHTSLQPNNQVTNQQRQYTVNANPNMQWRQQTKTNRNSNVLSQFPQKVNNRWQNNKQRTSQSGNSAQNSLYSRQSQQQSLNINNVQKPLMSEFTQNEVVVRRLQPARPTVGTSYTFNPIQPTQYAMKTFTSNPNYQSSAFSRRA